MKLIYKPRMGGKTTELIKLAAKGRYKLIVVGNRHMVDWTWKKILEMKKKDKRYCTKHALFHGQKYSSCKPQTNLTEKYKEYIK